MGLLSTNGGPCIYPVRGCGTMVTVDHLHQFINRHSGAKWKKVTSGDLPLNRRNQILNSQLLTFSINERESIDKIIFWKTIESFDS